MASAYFYRGALIESLTSTPTSGGNLVLTNASDPYQILTGTQAHTVTLPDATTLVVGKRFEITNASTQEISVNDNGANLLGTIAPGATRIFRVTDIGTANGAYDISTASAGGGGLSSEEAAQFNALAATGFSAQSRVLKLNPETLGGNHWTVKTPVAVAVSWPTNFSLGGYAYSAFGVNNSSTDVVTTIRYDLDNNYFLARGNGITAADSRAPLVLNGYGYAINGDGVNAVERYDAEADSWLSRAAIGTAYYGLATFALYGKGYTAGGTGGGATLTNIYDDVLNAWASRAPIPASMSRVPQGDGEYNGYGYVLTPSLATTVYRYDPIKNLYTLAPSPSTGHALGAVASANGSLILSMGENTGGTAITTGETFSDASNAWKPISATSQARMTSGATVSGQFMAISGGIGTGTAYTVVEQFTSAAFIGVGVLKKSALVPTTIAVSAILNDLTPNVPVQLRTDGDNWKTFISGQSPLKLNETLGKFKTPNFIYAQGGLDGAVSTIYNVNQFYNPDTNAWGTKTVMTNNNARAGRFGVEGKSYVFGGVSNAGGTPEANSYVFNELLNTWSSVAPIGANKVEPVGIGIDEFGYAITGSTDNTVGNSTVVSYKYSPASNAWNSIASIGTARYSAGIGTVGNIAVVFGGYNSSGTLLGTSEAYNAGLNSWANRSSLNLSSVRMAYGNLQGKVICSDGDDNGSANLPLQEYDYGANAWTTRANIGVANKYNNQGTSYGDDEFYTYGGNPTPFNQNYRWSKVANAWTSRATVTTPFIRGSTNVVSSYRNYEIRVGVPAYYAGLGSFLFSAAANLTTTRSNPVSGLLNGVSIAAQLDAGAGSPNDAYLADQNVWIATTPITTNQNSGGSFVLGNLLYVFGGPIPAGSTVNRFNYETKSWGTVANLGTAANRFYGNGRALNGYGYKIGGYDNANQLQSVERYNPSTNAWSSGGTLTNNLSQAVGTGGVYEGFAYRFGGFNTNLNTFTNVTDEYNDASNTWSSKANLPNNLSNTTSKEIDSGIMLVGGNIALGTYTAAMLEYKPALNSYLGRGTWSAGVISQAGWDGRMLSGGYNGAGLSTSYKYVPSVKQALLSAGLSVT